MKAVAFHRDNQIKFAGKIFQLDTAEEAEELSKLINAEMRAALVDQKTEAIMNVFFHLPGNYEVEPFSGVGGRCRDWVDGLDADEFAKPVIDLAKKFNEIFARG